MVRHLAANLPSCFVNLLVILHKLLEIYSIYIYIYGEEGQGA